MFQINILWIRYAHYSILNGPAHLVPTSKSSGSFSGLLGAETPPTPAGGDAVTVGKPKLAGTPANTNTSGEAHTTTRGRGTFWKLREDALQALGVVREPAPEPAGPRPPERRRRPPPQVRSVPLLPVPPHTLDPAGRG